MSETYNGWTNYATWRINLEIFDGRSLRDYSNETEVYEVAKDLQSYVEDFLEQTAQDGINKGFDLSLMRSYALAFVSDVNWHEIAEHMVEDHVEEESEE